MARWGGSRGAAVALVTLVVLAACGTPAHAASDVVKLTAKNFKKEVLQSDNYWLVEFFAPWCGHCKNLAPEWEKAATQLKTVARLGAVDATVHTSLAQKYGVQGYPTIVAFGKDKKKHEPYQGGRTASDIVNYVKRAASGMPAPSATSIVEFESVYSLLAYTTRTPEEDTKFVFLHEGGKFGAGDEAEDSETAVKRKKKRKPKTLQPPGWFDQLGSKVTKAVKKERKAEKKGTRDADAGPLPPPVEFASSATADDGAKIAEHLGLVDADMPAVVAFQAKRGRYVTFTQATKDRSSEVAGFIREVLRAEGDIVSDEAPQLPVFPTKAAKEAAARARRAAEKKKAAAKEAVAELNAANAQERCFGAQNKNTCAILVSTATSGRDGEAALRTAAEELAAEFAKYPFNFVYVHGTSSHRPYVAETFSLSSGGGGSFHLVLLKTGKRQRYVALADLQDTKEASGRLEAFVAGDLTLTRLEDKLALEETDEADEHIEL